jgi:hypothetical protein
VLFPVSPSFATSGGVTSHSVPLSPLRPHLAHIAHTHTPQFRHTHIFRHIQTYPHQPCTSVQLYSVVYLRPCGRIDNTLLNPMLTPTIPLPGYIPLLSTGTPSACGSTPISGYGPALCAGAFHVLDWPTPSSASSTPRSHAKNSPTASLAVGLFSVQPKILPPHTPSNAKSFRQPLMALSFVFAHACASIGRPRLRLRSP